MTREAPVLTTFGHYIHPHRIRRTIAAQVPRKAARDLWNRWRYGPDAPLSDAAIFVSARQIAYAFRPRNAGERFRRHQSGAVIGGDWDQSRVPVADNTKVQSCYMRFVDGADWSDTPIYRRHVAEIAAGAAPDGMRSIADLNARCAALDLLYAEARATGRLQCVSERPEAFRREHGGVLVHVGRDGTCLRSGGGWHRFAIAHVLDLAAMPAQIGVVHPQAIASGALARLMVPQVPAADPIGA